MTTAVVSIDIDEPVTEAVRLFACYPMHHLPVVDESVVKGMLSSADMLKLEYFLPRGGAQASAVLLNQRFRIATLMRSPVVTADLDDTIGDAASRMVTHAIHALPVVNDSNQLLGIVTTSDIMQALLHGIGLVQGSERREHKFKPTEVEIHRAMEAAESAILHGADADGIAALMLYLKERNAALESLRLNVARFLREGQDERLHARLVKDIDRLSQSGPLDI
jgi:CBS domain-containing protein